jgi:hypothetical protein
MCREDKRPSERGSWRRQTWDLVTFQPEKRTARETLFQTIAVENVSLSSVVSARTCDRS